MAKLHISEHLANERTFLAFLRTSVALVTFGITINRFSLFLLQQKTVPARTPGYSDLVSAEQAGIGMIIAGALLMVIAVSRFLSVSAAIERDTYEPKTAFAVVIAAIVLLACGTSLWLFSRG